MIHVKKCCLCYELRLGAQIISIIGFITGIILLIIGFLTYHMSIVERSFFLSISLIIIAINVCLAYGAAKKETKAIQLWLIATIILIILGIIGVLCEIIITLANNNRYLEEELIVLLLLAIGICIYFFICVNSFNEEVRLGKYRHEFNNIFVDTTATLAV